MTPRPRVLDHFPHPVALPYSLVFDGSLTPSARVWALCFTQYQVLRLVVLAHVSQYLRDEIDTTAKAAVKTTNEQIAGLKSPMFSNWVTAVRTLPRQWAGLKLAPPFPGLPDALKAMPAAVRGVPDSSGATTLPPLEAVVALRNRIAHGGIPDEPLSERHLAEYLPVLDEVLTTFDFLGDCRLLVCDDVERVKQGLPVKVQTLRGVATPAPHETNLSPELEAAFGESAAVLVTPADTPIPLDPLLRPLPHDEPLYLYDGHYGIRVTAKTEAVNRYVYYLGVRDKRSGTAECQTAAEHLRTLLAARNISYDLPKDKVHPWTIAEAALEYSRRTLADLLGTKYFPECYEPFPKVDDHLDRFLRVPDRKDWKDTARPRFRNGLLLLGTAGSGKTALLARRVEQLLAPPEPAPGAPADPDADRRNPNVVLFLRGNGIALRPDGVSLYRDVAEKLGVAVGEKVVENVNKPFKAEPDKHAGIGSFDELFAHLHKGFVNDQVSGRRLVLVFDALNEAPFAEQITREALQLVSLAARYPWCKVVLSTRDEWLAILPEKMSANEADPRADARDHLYDPNPGRTNDQRRLPALTLDPLAADHAERIYRRHQDRVRAKTEEGYAIPACATPWDELPEDVRKLLTNPLYLYLFQRAFAGRPVGVVGGVPELYSAYVESAYERNIGPAVRAVVEYLCAEPNRATADLTDDDVNALRLGWNAGRTAVEIRADVHPAEMLVLEGFVTKREGVENGGYRFVYQTVAEYLIYRDLRERMPTGNDEFAYWLKLAQRETVFPEYAGAFLFLLRSWEQSDDKREWIGNLVEAGSEWTGPVLTKLLDELAKTDFVPGEPSVKGERLAGVLAKRDSQRLTGFVAMGGHSLIRTAFVPTAIAYLRASADAYERLLKKSPADATVVDELAGVLTNWGLMLTHSGRIAEAEPVCRRCVEVCRERARRLPLSVSAGEGFGGALMNLALLLHNSGRPTDAEAEYRGSVGVFAQVCQSSSAEVATFDSFATALNGLGNVLADGGRSAEAEAAFRQGLRIREELHRTAPDNRKVSGGLANILNNLGTLFRTSGRAREADDKFRRSIEMYEVAGGTSPGNVELAGGLGTALNNLGLVLSEAEQGEAEAVYRRSLQIREELYLLNPTHVENVDGLSMVLNNLGLLLSDNGRVGEAEVAFRRGVQVSEELLQRTPLNADAAGGLASALTHLGTLLSDTGRVAEAEAEYRRSIEVAEGAYRRNPMAADVAEILAMTQNNLAVLLSASERIAEAETVYRRSVEIREALFRTDPDNVMIAESLAGTLGNLGALLVKDGRVEAAKRVFLRQVQVLGGIAQNNPGDSESQIEFARSLCVVGRFADARKVVDKVLKAVPTHTLANDIHRWLRSQGH